MSKHPLFIDIQNQYPFPQNHQSFQLASPKQLRKIISYDKQPRFICKQKIRILKSLGFQNLIALQSTKSNQHSVILFFQYVPFQFLTQGPRMGQQNKNKIQNSMLQLCDMLASRFILHDLDIKRVGLDKGFNLKYYLGIDFKIDKTLDKKKILQNYKNQINKFIQPFRITQIKPLTEKESPQNVIRLPIPNPAKPLQYHLNILKGAKVPGRVEGKTMKKSSILISNASAEKESQMKGKNLLNRFTFNYENQIKLPQHEDHKQDNELFLNKQNQNRSLLSRINALKSFMKSISIKPKLTNRDQSAQIKQNKFNKQQESSDKPDKFSNESQKSTNNESTLSRKNPYQTEINHNKGVQQAQRTLKSNKMNIKNADKKNLCQTVLVDENKDQSHFAKKNSLNLNEDNSRQHQQYLMLANNDKYCEQFMHFLEDNQSQKKDDELMRERRENIQFCHLNKKDLDEAHVQLKKQNIRTQSSENVLQIKRRVEKVIKSSLKLINGLRCRESIRCE